MSRLLIERVHIPALDLFCPSMAVVDCEHDFLQVSRERPRQSGRCWRSVCSSGWALFLLFQTDLGAGTRDRLERSGAAHPAIRFALCAPCPRSRGREPPSNLPCRFDRCLPRRIRCASQTDLPICQPRETLAKIRCRRWLRPWPIRSANSRRRLLRRDRRCPTSNWRNWCATNMCG